MRKSILILLLLLSACGQAPQIADTPTSTVVMASATPQPATATAEPQPTVVPGENPLTGLTVPDPARLDRRPMAIKISNYPRGIRPQWGLMKADHVYEYYIEGGETRFIAIFYGDDATTAGPIRSARYFDTNIIQMYKAIFAYGSGDERVRDRLDESDFKDRLVSEFPAGCPPMCRVDPGNWNHLVTDTRLLSQYMTNLIASNKRQDLSGLTFDPQPPDDGKAGETLGVRYSCWSYSRWDYDSQDGRYLRSEEAAEDIDKGETYQPLIDRLTGEPVSAQNVVALLMKHDWVSLDPEMVEMQFTGSGAAYLFRDGQIYQGYWKREGIDSLFSLVKEDGTPLPLKPGNTWFQVVGTSAPVAQNGTAWQILFREAAQYVCPGKQ